MTKTYRVRMLALGKEGEVREVDLPPKGLPKGPVRDEILSAILHYGQNAFQPKNHPSVSVGDVIELD